MGIGSARSAVPHWTHNLDIYVVVLRSRSNGPPARGAALNCRTDCIVGAHGEGPERAFRT